MSAGTHNCEGTTETAGITGAGEGTSPAPGRVTRIPAVGDDAAVAPDQGYGRVPSAVKPGQIRPRPARPHELRSNAQAALEAARETPAEPVPLHIRNAPTDLMKGLGYGKDYRYDPDEAGGFAAGQGYLPDRLRERRFYAPRGEGAEAEIAARLARWTAARAAARGAAKGGPA